MDRKTTLERDKFEEVDNEIVVDVVIVEGNEMPIDPTVRTTTLEKDKFTDIDGKTAVRVNILGGSAGNDGVGIFELDFFIDTAGGSRVGWVVDGTDLKLTVVHSLGTENLVVEFYETNLDGAVFVPWQIENENEISACIPAGSAFNGMVKILSRVASGRPIVIAGYTETFTVSKFIETEISGEYLATFAHGLGTASINYNFYLDNNCPNLICANTITTSQLTLRVSTNERFGGRVIIEKTS